MLNAQYDLNCIESTVKFQPTNHPAIVSKREQMEMNDADLSTKVILEWCNSFLRKVTFGETSINCCNDPSWIQNYDDDNLYARCLPPVAKRIEGNSKQPGKVTLRTVIRCHICLLKVLFVLCPFLGYAMCCVYGFFLMWCLVERKELGLMPAHAKWQKQWRQQSLLEWRWKNPIHLGPSLI